MSDKPRWPLDEARAVAAEIVTWLRPFCSKIEVAGSVRRRRESVGDIEIVYVSKFGDAVFPGELLPRDGPLAEPEIGRLVRDGVLARRPLKNGATAFGPRNKLLVHAASGIPVDLFSTEYLCWWNYLVCRTGGAESNIRIATAARRQGMKWTPYGPGFLVLCGGGMRRILRVSGEREVFEAVKLPYLEPWERP